MFVSRLCVCLCRRTSPKRAYSSEVGCTSVCYTLGDDWYHLAVDCRFHWPGQYGCTNGQQFVEKWS